MKRIVSTLALVLFIISTSFTQTEALQVVDHNSRHAHVSSMKAYNGGVLYSSQNDLFPLTRLNYINDSGDLVELFESYYEHRFVKYYPQVDGTMHIYMCGLFDYDLAIGSIYKFIFDGVDLELIDLNFWYYFDYITEVEVLNDESIYYIMNSEIIHIDQSGTVLDSVLTIQSGIYNDRLFQDKSGQVYLWNKKEIIRLLGDNQVETAFEIQNDSDDILDIKVSEDGYIFIATNNFCQYLNPQFEEIINYDYPLGYEFKYGVELEGEAVFYIQLHDEFEEPSLWHNIDPFDQLVHIHDYISLDMEILQIEFVNQDLLLGGFFESIKPAGIIKSFPGFEKGQYDYVNISLDEFNLKHASKDTAWTYIDSDGNEVVNYNYTYEYDFTVSNIGNQNIEHFDVYSTNYFGQFENKIFFTREVTDGIEVGETKTFTGSFELWFSLSLQDNAYTYYIPGANHLRDDEMGNNSIEVTIISSTDDNRAQIRDVNLYPNPTDQYLNITGNELNNLKYKLVDLNGKVFKFGNLDSARRLDLSQLSTGIYYLVLEDESGYHHTKMIMVE